jgi:hypothetical protein
VPERLHSLEHRELGSAQAERGDPPQLLLRVARRGGGQAADHREALGVAHREPGRKVVVDAHHGRSDLGVLHALGRPEDPVHDLGHHAVALLVLHAQRRIRRAQDPLELIVVEARLRHAIGPRQLAGDVLVSRRAHAARKAEASALVADPDPPLLGLDHARHALAQRRGSSLHEELLGQAGQVDVALRRDHGVDHLRTPCPVLYQIPAQRGGRRGPQCGWIQ